MPRIRTIKPNHWTDKALTEITLHAHLLWIATWNFSDDEGIFEADPLLLRSNIFPRRTDIRTDQIAQWLDQLVKARFIIPFQFEGEGYYITRTFKTHQKIDRAQKSKIPSDVIRRVFDECSTNVRPCIVEESNSKVKETLRETAKAVPEADASGPSPQDMYEKLEKSKQAISKFIKAESPDWVQPYVDLWNIFAKEKSLAQISKVNTTRKKKFQVRRGEKSFDFIDILRKAAQSEFLLRSRWFSFDWVFENDSNYLKIMEGNYDLGNKNPVVQKPRQEISDRDIDYLVDRHREKSLDKKLVTEDHFHFLNRGGKAAISQNNLNQAIDARLKSLMGSNQSADLQLIKDYEAGIDSEVIKADWPKLHRLAKRIAVFDYLETQANHEQAV